MSPAAQGPIKNRLIAGLSRGESELFLRDSESIELQSGKILCEPEQPFQHIYFPQTGFISVVIAVNGHESLEMGLVGSEGMLGATLALGVKAAPLQAIVQGPGTALRMTAAKFRTRLNDCPGLLAVLNRYIYILMAQLSQTAACGRFHETEPRLARWLLMTHDCAQADHFHLTHNLLAHMLGVRRSAITIAAGGLQRKKIIQYSRGRITILDRPGLEKAACECYGAHRHAYRSQMEQASKNA